MGRVEGVGKPGTGRARSSSIVGGIGKGPRTWSRGGHGQARTSERQRRNHITAIFPRRPAINSAGVHICPAAEEEADEADEEEEQEEYEEYRGGE